MATAGFGALAVVAGSAAGIAAVTSSDTRVVTAVGSDSSVVELPPAGDSELGAQKAAGRKAADKDAVARANAARSTGDRSAGLPDPGRAAEPADDGRSTPAEADRTATRTPRRTAPSGRNPSAASAGKPARPAGPAGPMVHVQRVSESEAIPFRTKLIRDPSMPPGSRRIQTPGIPGERVLHYEVTFTGSMETSRRLIDSSVTREPQHRVVAFGNRRGAGPFGGGRDGRRECQLRLGPCIGLARNTACVDGGEKSEKDLIDGDLSLLTAADIDELQLTLPCVVVPKDDPKDEPKKDAANEPAAAATPDAVPADRRSDGKQG
ncbi:G5 domain-containing protein [Actinoplanes sp. NPDC049668]|uniref:G5 domain-containing protein n=1 Tax=unclassified Actinoplanes TaxID=2626549 RepID=UPI0033ABE7ED